MISPRQSPSGGDTMVSDEGSSSAAVVQPWVSEPCKLWSLYGMLYVLGRFLKLLEDIEKNRALSKKGDPDDEIEHRQNLRNDLGHWRVAFTVHDFDHENRLCYEFEQRLHSMNNRSALERLDQLEDSFRESALDRFVCVLRDDSGDYIEKSTGQQFVGRAFGDPLDSAFPLSTAEIREARLCYVLDRPTACVFHLMRAVEYGLRELAACSGVTNPKVALEFQCWHTIIEQVESNYRTATKQWPKGAEKSAALAFFGATVSALYGFKDDVRNILMHARHGSLYDEDRARSVMSQVEPFMERLASKLSENCGVDLLNPGAWR